MKSLKSKFKAGMRVQYIPQHIINAGINITSEHHPETKTGKVYSFSDTWIFVQFKDSQLPYACLPQNLRILEEKNS